MCSALTAYPSGVLADNGNRRRQLALGITLLLSCHVILATAETIWLPAVGACLWGLQMGVTQGLLTASIADAAPEHLRGTAFGIYYFADGMVSLVANAGAGIVWTLFGSAPTFGLGAGLATTALFMLAVSPFGRRHITP